MGHSENKRNRENQPEKGALDTNQDKGIEELKQPVDETKPTEETEEKEEETLEPEEDVEEEPIKEESAEMAEEEKLEEAPEEEKEEKKKREEAEEEIVEERIYTIPLSRAVRIVRSFIQKHMKIEERTATAEEEGEGGKVVISDEVNKKLWSRGIEKPPRNIRVRAVKDKEGIVTLYLAEGD